MNPTKSSTVTFESEVRGWLAAGQALGLRVEAPYTAVLAGRSYRCVAWLPAFASMKGMLVCWADPPHFATDSEFLHAAEVEDIGFSYVNVEWREKSAEKGLVEMLSDWG